MSTPEKTTTTTTPPKSEHYHAWSGETAGEEVTVLRKGPTFKTRKLALVWLRERCGELAKVLVCRDKLCPSRERTCRLSPPGSKPGGSPF